jgi:AraC-like DNA-binding protein
VHIVVSQIDVSAGTVTYPPGGALGPRRQLDVQLVLMHSGSATVWVDDVPRRLEAGQVGLLLPGHRERFAFDPAVATRHSWVQVRAPDLDPAALPPVLPLSPALEALAREAVAARVGGIGIPPLLAHLAMATLWRYAAEAERGRPERARPVDDARRYIHAHLGDPGVTLASVARAAHVTPPHLVRAFRTEHGTTPIAYLWERRTALGIDLLSHTGLPIELVAERCGFRTAHHFSRRVRRASGLPPGALRRTRWGA